MRVVSRYSTAAANDIARQPGQAGVPSNRQMEEMDMLLNARKTRQLIETARTSSYWQREKLQCLQEEQLRR